MTDSPFKAMSVEDYLRLEEQSPFKHEYVGGFVYPLHGQAGVSQEHSRITLNLNLRLGPSALQQGCRIHSENMRLLIAERRTYYYPDLMVSCASEHLGRYHETRPCLLIEVLSESTAHMDKATKLGFYTAIPSLQTYLIVEQDERRVYAYQRENNWEVQEYAVQGDIPIPCLGRSLSLDEVYDGVR